MEQWHTIRCLHQRGESRRAIARQLGISRNTVGRALDGSRPPGCPRPPAADAGPHGEAVRGLLARGLRGSRVLKELRDQHGFTGSQAGFYRLLNRIQEEGASARAALRFETGPGQQAQFDWAEYAVTIGGQVVKVFVYAVVLGFSRRCHWFPSLSVKQPAIFEAIEAGWRHFGGACRELVVDNPRALVTRHTRAELVWHPMFLRLCGHYRVQPVAGTPRHPQGKGKVENPFGLLERHFIDGGRWATFGQFGEALAGHERQWEERIHGTTGASPAARFAEEQGALIALPPRGLFGVSEVPRSVSWDCLVSYEGVRYSVPCAHAGKPVWVRPSQGRSVTVLAPSGEVLASHPVPAGGSRLVTLAEHYAPLRKRHRGRLPALAARFRERYAGETAEALLQRLIGRSGQPERDLGRLLELLQGVPEAVAAAVLRDGLDFNLPTIGFLEGRLQQRSREAGPDAPPPPPGMQLALPALDVERPLAGYAQALPPPPDPGNALAAPGALP